MCISKSSTPGKSLITWLHLQHGCIVLQPITRSIISKEKNYLTANWDSSFLTKKQYDEIKEETDDNHPIMKCLDDVKPDYRICLVLREIEEMSYDKIAETLNITLGTVKSRINRAKKELHAIYEKEGVNV